MLSLLARTYVSPNSRLFGDLREKEIVAKSISSIPANRCFRVYINFDIVFLEENVGIVNSNLYAL